MSEPLDIHARQQLFTQARSQNAWLANPISDELLRELFELTRWGPTSMNCSPMRVTFVRSPGARERLLSAVSAGNVEKVRSAPIVAIIAHDLAFYEKLSTLFPHRPNAGDIFRSQPALAEETGFRNSSLQGGYFILAARLLGLDCGPLSGFDARLVNSLFFEGTSLRVNFLCCLGYGDPAGLFPRSPRFEFDDACMIV
ncbi:malonic semialdehyde reductase [Paraburkholderia susongensis]|uniref:Putative NADH dehydrogenase/NAD(P)H nitroreductase SAMN06265784_113127 n=1 Tax=Paraburkholderia susongensis TaxID=1515439 RepID=A0A1X7M223_9BURK|nr:malonic semialdehyde reductase [Paraburkholderia susongensis]SMG59583.1 3-hydroxypropanoate dehydrogenase [Paraburkholderia susongensis]